MSTDDHDLSAYESMDAETGYGNDVPVDSATQTADDSRAVRSVPSFCRRCGAPWDPAQTECPFCVARAAPILTAGDVRRVRRPVASTLWLYFALLGSTVLGVVLTQDDARGILLISGADTLIVLIWAIPHWHDLAGGLSRLGSLGWYVTAVGAAAVTFALASASMTFLERAAGMEVLEIARPFADAGYGWATILMVGCVQPAIVEELAFRGIMLAAMQRVLPTRDAILVSALLFMTIHLTVPAFPHLLLMGIVLGYVRVRSSSLFPCVILHFTHNLLCMLAEGGLG